MSHFANTDDPAAYPLSIETRQALAEEANRRGLSQDALVRRLLADAHDTESQSQLLAKAPEPLVITDMNGLIVYANPAFDTLLGYPVGGTRGMSTYDLLDPADAQNARVARDKVPTGGARLVEFTGTYVRRDGASRVIHWVSQVESGRIYSVGRDVTDIQVLQDEMMAMQETVRMRMNEFRALVENNPDWVARLGRDHHVLYVNASMADALSLPPETLVGRALRGISFGIDFELAVQLEQALNAVLDSGQTLTFEFNAESHDGAEHTYEARLVPEFAPDERIASVLMIAHDITRQRELESELRERETWFRGIVESQVDLVSRFTSDLTLVFVNDAYCRYFGGKPEDYVGRSILDLEDPKTHNTIKRNMQDLLNQPGPLVQEFKSYWPDGRERWIQWVSTGIRGADGIGLYQSVGRDVTAQRQLEAELRERETWYRGIVESQIDLVSRHTTDGTLIFVNDAYCKYFGREREEILGRSYMEIEPESNHAELRRHLANMAARPGLHIEAHRTSNADGRDRWVQWVSYAFADDDGKVTMIQSVGRDITDLKQTERTLRDSEERFRLIFETVSEGIILIDPLGRIRLVNRTIEERCGMARADLANRNVGWLFTETARKLVLDAINRTLTTNETIVLANEDLLEARTVGGELYPVELSMVPLTLSGAPMVICLVRDITGRRQLEQQRLINRALEVELEKERELIDLKQRFTHMVTHEFRLPLTVIQSTIDIVLNYADRLSQEKLADRLDIVAKQAQRMNDLLEDALTYSRGEAVRVKLTPEQIDLVASARTAIDDLSAADNASHRITLDAPEPVFYVLTDQRMLEHILTNLIGNAIKYSPAGSDIAVQIRRDGDDATISVTDRGIGIPDSDVSRIFQPFHRGQNVGSRGGSGLGLPIVKQSLDALGGEIHVKTQVGKGTTFTVRIPAAAASD